LDGTDTATLASVFLLVRRSANDLSELFADLPRLCVDADLGLQHHCSPTKFQVATPRPAFERRAQICAKSFALNLMDTSPVTSYGHVQVWVLEKVSYKQERAE
jgi:hypothetical protein